MTPGLMTNVETLREARRAFDEKVWGVAYRLFERADRESPLEPEDLERFATAAYLIARDPESESFRERAHHAYLERGDHEGAARAANWLAFGLLHRGAAATASGWFARAERLVQEAELDSVVSGYLLVPTAVQRIVKGDPAAGYAVFDRIAGIAQRFDDRDLLSTARHGRGRALIRQGQIAEGVAHLDEAMVAVVAGEVSPVIAGDVYCSVLEGCQEIFDLRRAYEWTTSLAQWCAAQPDLVRFRGECLLYRAEVLQLRGRWSEAADDARAACELLVGRPMFGSACYRLGDIHRLRGEFEQAEAAYVRANEHGRKPQPGLCLLRLSQGQIDMAAAAIRGVLADTHGQAARARALPAAVEILLAVDDVEQARSAAAELSDLASVIGAPLLCAAAAQAMGAVQLAEADIAGAALSLRGACEIWRDLEMPYEEAHTCLLVAAVCAQRGDEDNRRLELDRARSLFTRLGATACLARIEEPCNRPAKPSIGSLSDREVQVLRLLRSGKTNRAIAEKLFISDKTVARHVSNIFDKLGVSTRTEAAAWAFEHDLT
jgi:DNA-binding CsgD family transcriptional regulator/tetratricopeptide (TPR) repeat protein